MFQKIIDERIRYIISNYKLSTVKYNYDINMSIDDINNVWNDFSESKYNTKKCIVNFKNNKDISSLKLALNEPDLSEMLILLFKNHIASIQEDLILFFFKKTNKILIKLKSFHPLLYKKQISLPFWTKIYSTEEFPQFKNIFNENKNSNLVILFYS